MDLTKDWIYDLETYKSAFTFAVIRADGKFPRVFEVSERTNELDRIYACVDHIEATTGRLVGFNNVGFDYPILHEVLTNRRSWEAKSGKQVAAAVYKLAQKQIDLVIASKLMNKLSSKLTCIAFITLITKQKPLVLRC
jgi:predicted PolB exonuclease-like 3'-5' exonuclease